MANKDLSCHILVREVALGMAGVLYENLMQDNTRYEKWKKICPDLTPKKLEKLFITHAWPAFIDAARSQLTDMLTMPNVPESQKSEIHEALVLDKALGRGEIKTQVLPEMLN